MGGRTLRSERVINATVTFLVLVRGKIFLYHLKAYIYGFILKYDAFSFFAPFIAKKGKKGEKRGKKRGKRGKKKKKERRKKGKGQKMKKRHILKCSHIYKLSDDIKRFFL